MKQLFKTGAVVAALALTLSGAANVSAQSTDVAATNQSELRALIDSLLEQVRLLQEQVAALSARTDALELSRDLALGDSGEDVELLQRVLATDPTLYPEGLVTGFFGPLTEAALKRFEARYKIDGDGEVDSRVRGVINDLLTEGNAAGFVPPGLLTAPGIQDREYEFEIEIKDGEVRYKINSHGRGGDDEDEEDEEENEDEEDDSDDDNDEDEEDDEEDDDDSDDEDDD